MSLGPQSCPGCTYSGYSHLEDCPNSLRTAFEAVSKMAVPNKITRPTIVQNGKEFKLMLGDHELGRSKSDCDARFHLHAINAAIDSGIQEAARYVAKNPVRQSEGWTSTLRIVNGIEALKVSEPSIRSDLKTDESLRTQ